MISKQSELSTAVNQKRLLKVTWSHPRHLQQPAPRTTLDPPHEEAFMQKQQVTFALFLRLCLVCSISSALSLLRVSNACSIFIKFVNLSSFNRHLMWMIGLNNLPVGKCNKKPANAFEKGHSLAKLNCAYNWF